MPNEVSDLVKYIVNLQGSNRCHGIAGKGYGQRIYHLSKI